MAYPIICQTFFHMENSTKKSQAFYQKATDQAQAKRRARHIAFFLVENYPQETFDTGVFAKLFIKKRPIKLKRSEERDTPLSLQSFLSRGELPAGTIRHGGFCQAFYQKATDQAQAKRRARHSAFFAKLSLAGFLSCERKRVKKKTASCVRIQLAVRKIPGIVLLSHSQIYSTIAAGALNYRVREGNECFCSAMDTGKYKTKK